MLFLVSIFSSVAQNSLNDYKYVIVPMKFDFQKSENKYKLNDLLAFLFNKDGFTVIKSTDEYPIDLSVNRCLAMKANVIDNSGMLSTKLKIELVDCSGKIIFGADEGGSRIKEYTRAYHEAIRESFESIKRQNYQYQPKKEEVEVVAITKEVPVESTQKEIKQAQVDTVNKTSKKEVVALVVSPVVVKDIDASVLYAQVIPNGYQLVDSSPKVVYIALKTSVKDMYVIKGANGIIYKNNDSWIAEFYEGTTLVQKELNVKLME